MFHLDQLPRENIAADQSSISPHRPFGDTLSHGNLLHING